MPRLNIYSLSGVFAILSLLGIGAIASEGDKLSKKDKKWLEQEVHAFITAEEIEIFKDLRSEDRELFKELFWARRDPDPMTPDNEFREEYKRRIKRADGEIRTPGQKGSLTDMGAVHMLLGGPNGTSQDLEEYDDDPFNRDNSKESLPQQLAWEYNPNPSRGIPDGLTVVFRVTSKTDARQRGGYRLVRSEEIEAVLSRAKDRYVVNRAVNYSRDEAGRLLEPSQLAYVGGRTKTLLDELLDTKIENPAIPFETWECFFQAEEGSVYVPTLFEIQADALSWNEDTAQVTLFGAVQNSEGLVLHPFEQAVDLVKNEDGTVSYELPLQVASGEYTFHFGVLDDKSNAVGTKVFPVVVPAFGDTLGLSSVIVYSEARQVADVAGTPGHAFQFGDMHLAPILGDVLTFNTSESLGIFYFVYGYGLDPETGQPSLTEQYIFFRDGKRLTQTAVQQVPADNETAAGNAVIALSHFDPGNYRVQVKVIDKVKEETLTQELEFALN